MGRLTITTLLYSTILLLFDLLHLFRHVLNKNYRVFLYGRLREYIMFRSDVSILCLSLKYYISTAYPFLL